MRRRTRRDDNHGEIVAAFERLGWSVLDLADIGHGCPDIVIGDRTHGTFMVEIKNADTLYGRKGLSKSQKEFERRWMGKVHVVRTVDEVIALTRELAKGERADGGGFRVTTVTSAEDAIAKLEGHQP